jgi:ankyrin repeat protein
MDLPIESTGAVSPAKAGWCSGLILLLCIVAVSARALSVELPPDMHHTDLHKAADTCDPERGRGLVDALSTDTRNAEINRLDRDGYTPLAYAARNGCLAIATILLEKGAAVDATDDHTRWTPLLQAADQRHADMVRYLLTRGASVNVRAGYGQTPLTAAILGAVFTRGPEGDRDDTVHALLDGGADVDLPGESGWTPLMTAVFQGDANLVQLLIRKGADLAIRDAKGKTALDYADEREARELRNILVHGRTTDR